MTGEKQISTAILETLLDQRENRVERGFYWENQIAFAYNSEKMEGSPLSERQTRTIFETRTLSTGGPVPVDSIIEASNQFRLFDRVLDTVEEPLTQELVKEFHRVLKTGTADEDRGQGGAGGYKTVPNAVDGIITSAPGAVPEELERLFAAYRRNPSPTIRDIAGLHVFFERIHPFQDGNGRVGRAIAFRECLAHGIAPFIILDETKDRYYDGLRRFSEEPEVLVEYFEDMQERYLEAFAGLIPDSRIRNARLVEDLDEYRSGDPFVQTLEEYFCQGMEEEDFDGEPVEETFSAAEESARARNESRRMERGGLFASMARKLAKRAKGREDDPI